MLSTFDGEELAYSALRAGASGYLLKDAGGDRPVASQVRRPPTPPFAADLVISLATVKTHVRHVLAELDLRDRAQAIVLAREHGLVDGS